MDNLCINPYRTGLVGSGIFLIYLGFFIWLHTKADEVNKCTKAFSREKDMEKKRG